MSDLPLPSFSTNLRIFRDIIYAFQAIPDKSDEGTVLSESLTSPPSSA
ncbi:MAG: hypothetical protein WAT46_18885 [Saprospiraceae bacterium]